MQTVSPPGYSPEPPTVVTVITTGIATNILIGFIIRRLELPIYLDTVGTFAIVILLGWRWGLLGALIAVVIGSLVIFPFYFYYSATAIGIVMTIEACRRMNFFRTTYHTIASGILVAVVAAILSAPVTAYLFGGITATGNDAITAFFATMGNNLVKSVFLSGFSSEPVDKILTALIAYWALRGLPSGLTTRYKLRPILD
jgi:energy-coupling factor transport system substrate-specific component